MRRFALVALAATAVFVAGCATRIVSSHVELRTDFTQYRTYDWGPADAVPTGDARLDNNAIFRDYFQGAIEKQLAARRLVLTSRDPDLLIHTHTNVTHQFAVQPVIQHEYRQNPRCQGNGCAPTIAEYEISTLMIDVVDARTNTLVWRAWSRDDMSSDIDDQQRLQQAVSDAVLEMMKRFPKAL